MNINIKMIFIGSCIPILLYNYSKLYSAIFCIIILIILTVCKFVLKNTPKIFEDMHLCWWYVFYIFIIRLSCLPDKIINTLFYIMIPILIFDLITLFKYYNKIKILYLICILYLGMYR